MNALQYSKKNTKKLTKGHAVHKRPSAVLGRRSSVVFRHRSMAGGPRSAVSGRI